MFTVYQRLSSGFAPVTTLGVVLSRRTMGEAIDMADLLFDLEDEGGRWIVRDHIARFVADGRSDYMVKFTEA